MPDESHDDRKERYPDESDAAGGADGKGKGGTAMKTKRAKKKAPTPARKPPTPLPPWKVLLHNSDEPTFDYVILTIVALTPLNRDDARLRTKEADESGVALLLTTHRERAELYQEQFQSKGLVVTIEPA